MLCHCNSIDVQCQNEPKKTTARSAALEKAAKKAANKKTVCLHLSFTQWFLICYHRRPLPKLNQLQLQLPSLLLLRLSLPLPKHSKARKPRPLNQRRRYVFALNSIILADHRAQPTRAAPKDRSELPTAKPKKADK